MGDLSTRPLPKNCRARDLMRLSLAVLFMASTVVSPLQAAQGTVDPDATASVETDTRAHDITMFDEEPGKERLYLSARLARSMPDIVSDMHWIVRNVEGEILQDATAAQATLNLEPGTYMIEALNGETKRVETIALPQGKSIEFGFVLNAGALRVLPRISAIPATLKATSKVFALSGIESGKLIATSKTSGRIFNLPAGYYRVKTSYEFGNVEAVADVRVRPGIMSAVNIDHRAGVARLSFTGGSGEEVQWNITDEDGKALPAISGTEAALVLRPGSYNAEVVAGSMTRLAKFVIENGKEQDIVLGN